MRDSSPTANKPTGTMAHALPPGTTLQNGTYTLNGPLAQGGFGIIYAAHDDKLDRLVAIKELFIEGSIRYEEQVQPGLASDPRDYDRAIAKFMEECATLSCFDHPGIVKVYNCFEENNTVYMVMEFLTGKTLFQLVDERGWLPEAEALRIVRQVATTLQVVHEHDLIHRDITPGNIMVCRDRRVVAIDFGLNRKIGETQGFSTRPLTCTTRFGTGGFAPLEQYGTQSPGTYTDIYSLGATLYFALTGTPPIEAPDRAGGHKLPPPAQLNQHVSSYVNEAILAALEMDTARRPQTAAAFLKLLEPPPAPVVAAPGQPAKATKQRQPPPSRHGSSDIALAWSWAALPLPLLVFLLPPAWRLPGAVATGLFALIGGALLRRPAFSWIGGLALSVLCGLYASGMVGAKPPGIAAPATHNTKRITRYEAIPFARVTERTSALPVNRRRIERPGKPGKRKVVIEVTGSAQRRIAESTVEAPVSEVVLVGTGKLETRRVPPPAELKRRPRVQPRAAPRPRERPKPAHPSSGGEAGLPPIS